MTSKGAIKATRFNVLLAQSGALHGISGGCASIGGFEGVVVLLVVTHDVSWVNEEEKVESRGCNCSMSEQAFRSSLAQFRWTPAAEPSPPQPFTSNPSGESGFLERLYHSTSAYVPLRSDERSNEEEAYVALSRWERYDVSLRISSKHLLDLYPVYWDSEHVCLVPASASW